MNEAAHFIQARAQSLSYEAVQFPNTAKAALAWLHRAVAWAEARGLKPLADSVRAGSQRIKEESLGLCEHRYYYQGHRTFGDNIPGYAQGAYFPGDEPGIRCKLSGGDHCCEEMCPLNDETQEGAEA